MESAPVTPFSTEDRVLVRRALRSPRGRYGAERASQLSGVPARTLYDWARSDTLIPDWAGASPKAWSYRDVVYVRLLAWLRSKGADRSTGSRWVAEVRVEMTHAKVEPTLHSDGRVLLLGSEEVDRLTGQQMFDGLTDLLDEFDIVEPIEEISTSSLWGPNLLRPSEHTFVSPWVAGGEPCVDESRVPTLSVYALHTERALTTAQIVDLYPGLDEEAVDDAIKLEERLRAKPGGPDAAAA